MSVEEWDEVERQAMAQVEERKRAHAAACSSSASGKRQRAPEFVITLSQSGDQVLAKAAYNEVTCCSCERVACRFSHQVSHTRSSVFLGL